MAMPLGRMVESCCDEQETSGRSAGLLRRLAEKLALADMEDRYALVQDRHLPALTMAYQAP